MKINKLLYKLMLIIMLILMFNSSISYASLSDPEMNAQEGGGGSETGIPEGLPDLELFEPTISPGGATTIIGQILGILRIIGAITIVVAIAVIGFNTILGSANEKAEYQQKLVGVLFAGIFLVASTSIATLIMSVAAAI